MLRNWWSEIGRGSSGASLLEVLIGGALVAIAAVGTALMFSSGQAFIQSEGDNRVALQIAQERIERVRAGGFGSTVCCNAGLFPGVCDGREEPACPNTLTAWATDSTNHPGYRWRTTIDARCPNNFAVASITSVIACPPGFTNLEAKLVTVLVQPLEGTSTTQQDRMAQPVTLQAMMVVH